jgi:radical SAM superfamily enzyme YgiQ (UPF0313 family)
MKAKKVIMFFPKLEEFKDYHYMPVSLLAVAAPLVKEGIDCTIIDERIDENYLETIDSQIPEAICFLITAYTGYQVSRAYNVAKYVKKSYPDIKIIWGGPHVTHLPDQAISSDYVDIVYLGYAESSIVTLIDAIINNKNLKDVENIYYKDVNKNIIKNKTNQKIYLEKMPEMPYQMVNHMKYINPKTKRFIYVSSYGCPGICTFCATKTRRRWIPLNLEKVEKDIENLMKLYDYKECVFFDATIFTLPERAIKLSEIMKKYNLRWICDARADEIYKIGDKELECIINNGLIEITMGLETGSEKIVSIMKKGENHLHKYEVALTKLAKYNVKVSSGVIFGTPGETVKELSETVEYIKKMKSINKNFYISTTFFRPLPDTELMDTVINLGYSMPKSLEEWAKVGSSNHYKYNVWMDVPWFDANEKNKYMQLYDNFSKEMKDIFC